MTRLAQILENHSKWVETMGNDGCRANLCEADLCEVDLREADLRRADLCGADLDGADLRGANLDYSCWPLWCGSFDVKVDKRIAAQIAYHFCRLDCDDPAFVKARNAIAEFANQFHRAEECGKIEKMVIEESEKGCAEGK